MTKTHQLKICFVGASYLFVHRVVKDLALAGNFDGSELVIYDIEREPAEVEAGVCRRISDELGAAFRIRAELDRAEAYKDADFVIICISVGGREASKSDIEICRRYGDDHVIGDTIGPAAIARNLRMYPVVVEIASGIEKYCPHAKVINFTNPMSVTTATLTRNTGAELVGLCHGTGELVSFIAAAYGVGESEVRLEVAGVNHLAFVTDVHVGGRTVPMNEMFDRLERQQDSPDFRMRDLVWDSYLSYHYTIELGRRLGSMPNNPDRHTCEFFPWFLYPWGKIFTEESADYDDRIRRHRRIGEQLKRIADGSKPIPNPNKPSGEKAEGIMLAMMGDAPGRFVVNVPNLGAIGGIPADAVVEVYKHVDATGLTNEATITLRPHLRNIIERLVTIHEYTMEAARTGSRELAMQGLMLESNNHNFRDAPPMLDELMSHNSTVLRQLGYHHP